MSYLDRAIVAGIFAIGLAASSAAFAEDKNATQNNGPARESASSSSHVEVPAPKAGAVGQGTKDGRPAEKADDGKKVTPTQTSGHDH
ncbi:hypothetical protein [Chenggangzhangella methanolivorans]|uniref:Uncharacterized protein n=2 Tax=Hyphomicrobiales TaxID=356 RepID=A0A9E6RBN1_9HYPH|nr:hypothetical protein [Chenggangzhangella methanolivorans]PZQ12455.1 MAG: hypothetical protein DI565_16680 [Ancylobacter novellus]QZO00339.1 hypothetical protein K6K41_00655 [Chenggangzhangella methanolivorans]